LERITFVTPRQNATSGRFLRDKSYPVDDSVNGIYSEYGFKYAVIERLDAIVDLLIKLNGEDDADS
jgi:hypothetical protein